METFVCEGSIRDALIMTYTSVQFPVVWMVVY